ncbi:efflux RND transporter periplasmic adaptor subunit [Bradyrhizobium sp.]|uniref:efflux RND transporter periplasmic adaptor subunit n=1 Tax=Bradyrhizobium sp. TaxID=376 RepID=UPI003C70A145
MRITIGRASIVLGVMAAAALIAWAVMPGQIPVELAAVTKGTFVASVDEDGKTRVRERYVVAAPLAGRLDRIRFEVGDQIQVDDTVATIMPSPAPLIDPRTRREIEERLGAAGATLERTRASVERALALSDQAKIDLARARTLVERGASTVQALERADLAMRVADRDQRAAEFQKHAAEHDLNQTRALLARYRDGPDGSPEGWNVTAPVGGVVLKVAQESETIVQPGTPLIDIGDPRDLEIVVDVLSTDAVEIRPGAEVAIEHWGGQGELSGRVRRVEPAAFTKVSTLGVEEQRVNVLVDVLSPAERWTGLGDGYQVDARISVFIQEDATIIPSGALFRHGDSWNVYIVKDGRAQIREIKMLRRSGRFAAVAAGLTAGEFVIVYPSDRVASGVRVELRQADNASQAR